MTVTAIKPEQPETKAKPAKEMTGAEIVIQALIDQGVDTIFGYPGGAVLPIYDALFQQKRLNIFWSGKRAAPSTLPRATPARPERSAAPSSPPAPAPPTPSRA